ncbi:MAG: hypothetical protein U5K27_16380 [Desulfotignum sp.]|nr:hypothetical protein [Desulfotignum sp.]
MRTVTSVYDADVRPGCVRKLYYRFFHPLGIKELAESKGLHTAYAIVSLLESMEHGDIEHRLAALRALEAEVVDPADGPMPKNTARVLLQIMKELVQGQRQRPPPAGPGPYLPAGGIRQTQAGQRTAGSLPSSGNARRMETGHL